MLNNEYKDAVLKKLNTMTAKELIECLERCGSKRVDNSNSVSKNLGDYHFNQYSGEPWYYK